MAKRFIWKEGGIVSFKVKEDLFTIGQMLKSPYVCFFQIQSPDGTFADVDLNATLELFVIPVARDFLQKRLYERISEGVKAKQDLALPELWIMPKMAFGGDFPWKGGDLVKIDHAVGDLGMANKVVKRSIKADEKEILEKYELTSVWTDQGLVERLILCFGSGKNINPFKDRIFFG